MTPARPSLNAFVVLATLVSVTVAGCLDQSEECDGGVCTEVANPGETFLTNATRPTASLQGCRGIGLAANVPPEDVADELPDAFFPQGFVPGTAQLQIYSFECSRVVVNGTGAEHVRLAYTSVDAAPHNRDWQGDAPSAYVFQYYADQADVAHELNAMGMPTQLANIEVEIATSEPAQLEAWTIGAKDHSIAYSFLHADGEGGGRSFPFYLWVGNEPFQRFDMNNTYEFSALAGLSPTVVTLEGPSALHRIVGTDRHPFVGQVWSSRSEEFAAHHKEFTRGGD